MIDIKKEQKRLFLAIPIPKELSDKISEAQKQLRQTETDVKWVNKENFHYNLKFFGHLTAQKTQKVIKLSEEVIGKYKPFEIHIADLGAFPTLQTIRVIWIGAKKGSSEMGDLFNDLEDRYKEIGIEQEKRKFKAHLTLGRLHQGADNSKLIKKMKEIEDIDIGTFKTSKIILFESKISPQGPTYTKVTEFNLSG